MTWPEIDLVTKAKILDLLHRRAGGADRFDGKLMRPCHPIDAIDNHRTYQGFMQGFIDTFESSSRTGAPYLAKVFNEPGGTLDIHIGGRYLDFFRRVDVRWLIQHRDIVYDW